MSFITDIIIGYSVVTWVMVFKTTFNNISVISWRSVLLVEETGVSGENHRQVTDNFYHIMLYQVHLTCATWSVLFYGIMIRSPKV